MYTESLKNTIHRLFVVMLTATMLATLAWSVTPAAPVEAATTGYVQQVDAGLYHTCMLTSAGGVKCWGSTAYGQVGNGVITPNRVTPVDVTGLTSGISAVVTGQNHSCALTTGGGVQCWGDNQYGQLGDGSASAYSATPVNVSGLSSGVSSIAAGEHHTCAVLSGGGVRCWGRNGNGQLGNGQTSNSNVPVNVCTDGPTCGTLLSGISAVAGGEFHTCALTTGGGVQCWGYNVEGQLGDNYASGWQSLIPVQVSGLSSGVTAITAGSRHTCAIVGGAAMCWGYNNDGQVGDNSTNNRFVPVSVNGLGSGVTIINAGYEFTCAVASDAAQCWGNNLVGQLGDGNAPTRSLIPVGVTGLSSGVDSVRGGGYHTCAVMDDGLVKCWGNGSVYQLGDGNNAQQNTPVNQLWLVTYVDPTVSQGMCAGNGPCYTSVQQAIDMATIYPFQGTVTINVHTGTYAESVTLNKYATLAIADGVTLNGSFTQSDSNATTSAPAGTFTITGDWTLSAGAFNHNNGTVVFGGSGTQTIGGAVPTQFYNLTVNSSSTVVIPTANTPTINGAITNNGALQETRAVNGTVTFLALSNSSYTTQKYWGLEINSGSNNLGDTVVTIHGNQFCPNVVNGVKRCFEITPNTPAATTLITFFYTEAERNGQTNSLMKVYNWNGSTWVAETIAGYGGSGDGQYVQASGISSFSPFALGNNTPTAVELTSFTAEAEEAGVRVMWETASELNNVGFNLYRATSVDGPWTQLNATLIPAQMPGSAMGATYTWLDEAVEPGQAYFYRLEDIDTKGVSTFHGPVSTGGTASPSAVAMQGFAAQGAATWAYGWVLSLGAALALARRKR